MNESTVWGYHSGALAAGEEVLLGDEEARHAAKVRRLSAGMALTLTDGAGRVARARLSRCAARPLEVRARIEHVDTMPQPRSITLACSFPKGDRQTALLEAATQLGATHIQPLHCEFTPPAARKPNRERAERILIGAMKQSRRAWLPQCLPVGTPQTLAARTHNSLHLVADPGGGPMADGPTPDAELWLWVGPEGGFSEAEQALLTGAGARPVRLGPHILRIETAAAALLACVAQWGRAD